MFAFRRVDKSDARTIISWRYEPPYNFYNNLQQDAEIDYLLHPQNNFYSILDAAGELVAYCSFGQDGQVIGGDYRDEALDIGFGIRPDLTGRGKGVEYAKAVLEFADNLSESKAFRVTIAAFNKRAIRVWQKLEFEHQQSFERDSDRMQFIILMRTNCII